MVVGMAPPERADLIFAVLGDRTRRDILSLVLVGEHSVSGLARRFPMSFAAVQSTWRSWRERAGREAR